MADPSIQIRIGVAVDQAMRGIDRATNALEGMRREIFSVQGALAGLGAGFVAQSFVNTAAEFERAEALLEGISKSAVQAEKDLQWIIDFNLRNPVYEIGTLQNTFVKLKTAGLDPTSGAMQALVDATAAFGGTSADLEKATVAVFQMMGKGAINMEELRQQLGERIPSAIRIMAQEMGVTTEELYKLTETAQLTGDRALQALIGMLYGFEKEYAGSAERLGRTWNGIMAQTRTQIKLFQQMTMEQGPFQEMKDSMNEFFDYLKTVEGQNFIEELAGTTADLAEDIIRVGRFAAESLHTITVGWTSLPPVIQDIGLVGALIGGAKARAAILLLTTAFGLAKELGDYVEGLRDESPYDKAVAEYVKITTLQAEIQAELQNFDNHVREMAARDAAGTGGIRDPLVHKFMVLTQQLKEVEAQAKEAEEALKSLATDPAVSDAWFFRDNGYTPPEERENGLGSGGGGGGGGGGAVKKSPQVRLAEQLQAELKKVEAKGLDGRLAQLEAKYQERLVIAKGNGALLLQVEEWYAKAVSDAWAKHLKANPVTDSWMERDGRDYADLLAFAEQQERDFLRAKLNINEEIIRAQEDLYGANEQLSIDWYTNEVDRLNLWLEENLQQYGGLSEEIYSLYYLKLEEIENEYHQKSLGVWERYAQELVETLQDDFAVASQNVISDILFDSIKGEMKSFEEYWDSFWSAMVRSFSDHMAKIAQEQLMDPLWDFGFGLLGKGVNAGIDAIFHTGGIADDEIVAKLLKDEMVIPSKQSQEIQAAMGNGGVSGSFFEDVTDMVQLGKTVKDSGFSASGNNPHALGAIYGALGASAFGAMSTGANNYMKVQDIGAGLRDAGYNISQSDIDNLAMQLGIMGARSAFMTGMPLALASETMFQGFGTSHTRPYADIAAWGLSAVLGIAGGPAGMAMAALGAPVLGFLIDGIMDALNFRDNENFRDVLDDNYGKMTSNIMMQQMKDIIGGDMKAYGIKVSPEGQFQATFHGAEAVQNAQDAFADNFGASFSMNGVNVQIGKITPGVTRPGDWEASEPSVTLVGQESNWRSAKKAWDASPGAVFEAYYNPAENHNVKGMAWNWSLLNAYRLSQKGGLGRSFSAMAGSQGWDIDDAFLREFGFWSRNLAHSGLPLLGWSDAEAELAERILRGDTDRLGGGNGVAGEGEGETGFGYFSGGPVNQLMVPKGDDGLAGLQFGEYVIPRHALAFLDALLQGTALPVNLGGGGGFSGYDPGEVLPTPGEIEDSFQDIIGMWRRGSDMTMEEIADSVRRMGEDGLDKIGRDLQNLGWFEFFNPDSPFSEQLSEFLFRAGDMTGAARDFLDRLDLKDSEKWRMMIGDIADVFGRGGELDDEILGQYSEYLHLLGEEFEDQARVLDLRIQQQQEFNQVMEQLGLEYTDMGEFLSDFKDGIKDLTAEEEEYLELLIKTGRLEREQLQQDIIEQRHAEIEAMKVATAELRIRAMELQGFSDAETEMASMRLNHIQEMRDAEEQFGADSDYVRHLRKVQEAEKEAARAAQEREAMGFVGSTFTRALGVAGFSDEQAQLNMLIAQEQELYELRSSGADDAQLAAVKRVQAMERESLLEQQKHEAEIEAAQTALSLYQQAESSLQSALDSILGSDLNTASPREQYAQAQREFARLAQGARNGDAEALAELGGAGMEYLSLSQQMFASGAEYQEAYTQVTEALEFAQQYAEEQAQGTQDRIDGGGVVGPDGSVDVQRMFQAYLQGENLLRAADSGKFGFGDLIQAIWDANADVAKWVRDNRDMVERWGIAISKAASWEDLWAAYMTHDRAQDIVDALGRSRTIQILERIRDNADGRSGSPLDRIREAIIDNRDPSETWRLNIERWASDRDILLGDIRRLLEQIRDKNPEDGRVPPPGIEPIPGGDENGVHRASMKYYADYYDVFANEMASGTLSHGALNHYQTVGQSEGRGLFLASTISAGVGGPLPSLEESFAALANPWGHPDIYAREMRYFQDHPDVWAAFTGGTTGSALEHYLGHGRYEGRSYRSGGVIAAPWRHPSTPAGEDGMVAARSGEVITSQRDHKAQTKYLAMLVGEMKSMRAELSALKTSYTKASSRAGRVK